MHGWAEEAARVHLRRNHIPDKELKRFFAFTSTCKRNLTRKLMFDKYRELRLRGAQHSASHLPVNRASLSVLIFFLHANNPRALEHLMHCSRTFFPALRRAFRQTWLRVQLFTCKYPINRRTRNTNVDDCPPSPSMSTSEVNEKKRSCPVGNRPPKAAKRTRTSVPRRRRVLPKRSRRTVQRFEPELTKLIDDHSEDSGDDCVPMEERSEDSDSEGSLKDFVVSDEGSESDTSQDSCEDERELSSYETSSESNFSIYSD